MKLPTSGARTRLLCSSFIVLAASGLLAAPALAQDQGCGGAMSISTNPNTSPPNELQFTGAPLGEVVRITLNPDKGAGTNDLTIAEVEYALACFNNQDQVPCTNGNDPAAGGGAPIAFSGNVSGTCGATDGTTVDNGDGTVSFNFDPFVLAGAGGCTVAFDVTVNDIGTDGSPFVLTGAAEAEGVCLGGALAGAAAGSVPIFLEPVPDIELLKEISVDGGTTWFDANDAANAPIVEFPSGAMYRLTVTNTGTADLTNIVINDPTLGIVNEPIADLAAGASVVLDSGDISALSVATRCDSGGTFLNEASVDADSTYDPPGAELPGQVSDSDPANLVCVGIDVDKTGDAEGKVGDPVDYTFTLSNLSGQSLDDCTAGDTILGPIFGPNASLPNGDTVINDSYVVQAGDDDPLPNTVTLSCSLTGVNGTVNLTATDDHSVDLLAATIEVTKTGPDSIKAGDQIEYQIGFSSTGDLALENCTGSDTVIGDLGAFNPAGETKSFFYTPTAQDPDSLENTATITCDVVGFSNQASDSATHTVELLRPDVSVVKDCRPDPVLIGETIFWDITVTNEGNTELDCQVSDPTAGIDVPSVVIPVGGFEEFNGSRTVLPEDEGTISNTATASCTIAGSSLTNTVDDQASDDCTVPPPGDEICRTPGFWGTHAGDAKRRSSNLTQAVIDAAGGSLSICGQTIDNTNIENIHSAVEAMCVRIEGVQQRQLARQLTAMALNCVTSGGGADCTGTSVQGLFSAADAACIANAGNLNGFIAEVDCFNNGGVFENGMCVTGQCSISGADCNENTVCPQAGEGDVCVATPNNCHDIELSESDVFNGISPLPGPAGSSKACSSANGNGWKVVPAPGGETP